MNCFAFGTIIKKKNKIIRCLLPNKISNFLSLRADDKINFDIKEIVSTNLLKNVIKKIKIRENRRIPTGLIWAILSEEYKCKSFSQPLL